MSDHEVIDAVPARTATDKWLESLPDDVVRFNYLEDGRKVIEITPALLEKVNLLGSITQVIQVSPHFTPMPKIIRVDIEKGTYKQQSVKLPDGSWNERRALYSRELSKIAAEVGIDHIHTDWDYMGGRGIRATVHAQVRGPDGTWRSTTKTKQVVFEHRERKIRNDAMAKWEKYNKAAWEKLDSGQQLSDKERRNAKPPPTESELQGLVDQDLQYLSEKVETAAWSRCLRDLLGIAPNYSVAELRRPFFTVNYAFTPDTSDPSMKQMIELQFREGLAKLYGGSASSTAAEGVAGALGSAPQRTLERPSGDYDLDEDDLGGDEEWPQEGPETPPSRPAIDPVLGGRFEGQKTSEVVQTDEGRIWIAGALSKLRNPATRDALLGWLSYAEQREITETEAAEMAAVL